MVAATGGIDFAALFVSCVYRLTTIAGFLADGGNVTREIPQL